MTAKKAHHKLRALARRAGVRVKGGVLVKASETISDERAKFTDLLNVAGRAIANLIVAADKITDRDERSRTSEDFSMLVYALKDQGARMLHPHAEEHQ